MGDRAVDIVYNTPDSIKIRIKDAETKDATRIVEFLKEITTESEFLITCPEEVPSVKEEEEFIKRMKRSLYSLFIIALDNEKVVGSLTFIGNSRKKVRHTGEFGISVLKEYRRKGIATRMIECMMEWAKRKGIEKIHLKVIEDNLAAISLYRKLGFEFEGRQEKAIKLGDGVYKDVLLMGIWLGGGERC